MKLSDAKRRALILMREWTNGGSVIPAADNADYLKSADDLATIAQNDISLRAKIPAKVTLTVSNGTYGTYYTFAMPNDYRELHRIVRIHDNSVDEDFQGYKLPDRSTIAFPNNDDTWILHYYKKPTQLTPDPANITKNDDYSFEVDEQTQDLIPFFIAAQLLMDENPSMATLKLNEYQARLENMQTKDVGSKKIRNVRGW